MRSVNSFAPTIPSAVQRLFAHATTSFATTTMIVFAFCAATAIAAPAQTFTTLLDFDNTNGASPEANLVQATNGNLYGTTSQGGANGQGGTIFQVTPAGTLSTLYNFCSEANCADGGGPVGGLIEGTNGNLYGTTFTGGAKNNGLPGTVFQITPTGTLTTLYNFCTQAKCADGEFPEAGLVQGTDGNLYGTTDEGGASGQGTVFKLTTTGKLTTLYSFCSQASCADGQFPLGGLVQGTGGDFYGTTSEGGTYGNGTVFKITPAGTLTTLHSFCSDANCTDGEFPIGNLVPGADGDYYGTTFLYPGTIFKITPAGTLTTLYSFCSQTNCTDGSEPYAGLVQGNDGSFYGSTIQGGNNLCGGNGCGTLFKMTPGLGLTTLHTFEATDGSLTVGGLMQDTSGTFYGSTTTGGNTEDCAGAPGCGTVFSLAEGLHPFVEAQTNSCKAGGEVVILGTNLTGATSVTFNGMSAQFTVVSGSEITTTVPFGATTGTLQVTTPSSGKLKSNTVFRVTPQLISFTPSSGKAETRVTITGVSLTQTTGVSFNGVPAASFTVYSDTEVTAVVPSTATTGKITITTKGGSATSASIFTVTE